MTSWTRTQEEGWRTSEEMRGNEFEQENTRIRGVTALLGVPGKDETTIRKIWVRGD